MVNKEITISTQPVECDSESYIDNHRVYPKKITRPKQFYDFREFPEKPGNQNQRNNHI